MWRVIAYKCVKLVQEAPAQNDLKPSREDHQALNWSIEK